MINDAHIMCSLSTPSARDPLTAPRALPLWVNQGNEMISMELKPPLHEAEHKGRGVRGTQRKRSEMNTEEEEWDEHRGRGVRGTQRKRSERNTEEEEWEEHRGRGVRWTQRTRSRINSMRVFCSSTFAQELLHVVLEGLKMLFFWKPHHLLHLGRARWGGQEWTIVTHQKLQKDACVKQQTKEKHNVYSKKKLGMRQERILIIFQNYSKSKIL